VIDNPPLNLLDSAVFDGLLFVREYVREPSHGVKVVVLESANPDFFVAHLDLAGLRADRAAARRVAEEWPRFSAWLSRAPVLTIAKIRGRARGIGNELVLACDLRFASRENARLSQIELGFGMVPGGGGLEWLPRLVGRARALEVVLGAEDFDGLRAEQYGWINRALPDAELDAHVSRLARRIASFDAVAIATAKSLVNARVNPPTEAELGESLPPYCAWPRGMKPLKSPRESWRGQEEASPARSAICRSSSGRAELRGSAHECSLGGGVVGVEGVDA
jgi:enoyl-CoA hydratase/carnithine racemase